MSHTPWTHKRPTNFVVSDKLKGPGPSSSGDKGKKQQQEDRTPRSKEVQRLDALIGAVRKDDKIVKDPNGGCFCQARDHPLSTYNPLCFSCGLILCSINLPQYACPHCDVPLHAGEAASRLVERLKEERNETLAREALERERAQEAAKRVEGAFPTLHGGKSGGSGSSSPANDSRSRTSTPTPTSHKVMSLTGNRGVVINSYTNRPVSRAQTPANEKEKEKEPEIIRVRRPPSEVQYAKGVRDRNRPWQNLEKPNLTYIPLAEPKLNERKGKKKKGGQTN